MNKYVTNELPTYLVITISTNIFFETALNVKLKVLLTYLYF